MMTRLQDDICHQTALSRTFRRVEAVGEWLGSAECRGLGADGADCRWQDALAFD